MDDLERIGRIRKLQAGPPSDASPRQRFSYQPLGKDEVRLINLLPMADRFDKLIPCEIVHANLSDEALPAYTALSYCWESEVLDHDILVESGEPSRIPITASLHRALIRLRAVRSEAINWLIWADAICIDQENVGERSTQVLKMERIYQKATKVAINIGGEHEDSQLFQELVRGRDRMISLQNMSEFLSASTCTTRERFWKAAQALLRRQWFSRSWVIQEVVWPQNTWIYCGYWLGPFKPWLTEWSMALDESIRHMQHEDVETQLSTIMGMRQLSRITKISNSMMDGKRHRLLHLLTLCRDAKTLLPVDHLYAMLGLSAEHQEPELAPNYRSSVRCVVKQYADFFVRHGELVCMLQSVDSRAWMPGYPTWVPNWIGSDLDSPWLTMSLFSSDVHGRASHRAGPTPACQKLMYDAQEETVGLRGILFDTTDHLGRDPRVHHRHNYELVRRCPLYIDLVVDRIRDMKSAVHGGVVCENLRGTIEGTLMAGMQVPVEDAAEASRVWNGIYSLVTGKKQEKDSSMDGDYFSSMSKRIAQIASSLQLCITHKSYLAHVPYGSCVNDVIALLEGHPTPYVLRPTWKNKLVFQVVGACYVHEVMDGRWWSKHEQEALLLWLV